MVGLLVLVWLAGFTAAGVGYYAFYRVKEPNFYRCVAAFFWPIGVPVDFIFYDRPSWRKAKRQQREVRDYYNNPPKLGEWR